MPRVPPGGYHPGGLLRLRGAVRHRADAPLRGEPDPDQDPRLRYPGVRRLLPRRGPAAQRARDHLRSVAPRRRPRPSGWNGTATTTSTRPWPTPAPPGSMAAPGSTPRCWGSASGPATARSRRWSLSTPPCAARWTAWIPPSSPRSPNITPARSATQIPPMTPLVGKEFNFTRSGIHADGLLKDEEIYNIFNTEKLLRRKVVVAVNEHSGRGRAGALDQQLFQPQGRVPARQARRAPGAGQGLGRRAVHQRPRHGDRRPRAGRGDQGKGLRSMGGLERGEDGVSAGDCVCGGKPERDNGSSDPRPKAGGFCRQDLDLSFIFVRARSGFLFPLPRPVPGSPGW